MKGQASCNPKGKNRRGNSCIAPLNRPQQVCEHCPLQGRKVVIIGGLDRLEPSYRETVQRLGGECAFHTGKLRSGHRRLKQSVAKADLVVFITSINSHAALNAVKQECKRCSKPFCALRQTGCGSLGETLRSFQGTNFVTLGVN